MVVRNWLIGSQDFGGGGGVIRVGAASSKLAGWIQGSWRPQEEEVMHS